MFVRGMWDDVCVICVFVGDEWCVGGVGRGCGVVSASAASGASGASEREV